MYQCNTNEIKDQLKRTEGQVSGIVRMFDDSRNCTELIQQILAARASLTKLGTMLLEAEAKGCIDSGLDEKQKLIDLQKIINNLFKIN